MALDSAGMLGSISTGSAVEVYGGLENGGLNLSRQIDEFREKLTPFVKLEVTRPMMGTVL